MATNVNEPVTVELIDGTTVQIRPLKISLLKSFMNKFGDIAAVAENNDKSMEILMECVQIAMRQYKPEIAEDLKALEDNLDLPTVYKIIEGAAGVKLSDVSSSIMA
jgi:hypothetical protein